MSYRNSLKLQCTFPKLSESGQFYVMGLIEGLKHAQSKIIEKLKIKTPNKSVDSNSAFYNRSVERKTFP
ncbi:MAG: hypothetical protein FWC05_04725 [Treponema sp.]|nr:hypothetical protein [Treponema sp.]